MASERYLWIRNGMIAGLVACAAYPSLLLLPLPLRLGTLVAFVFAVALGLSSVGLYHFLSIGRSRTMSLQVAMVSNILAGLAFVLMVFVQLSTKQGGAIHSIEDQTARVVDRIQLGMDVTWDVYLALGTALFALAAWRHPRLGRWFALSGFVIALALFGFNLATFPMPPGESGLVDVGPLVGLWYFAVAIQVLRSLRWVREIEASAN